MDRRFFMTSRSLPPPTAAEFMSPWLAASLVFVVAIWQWGTEVPFLLRGVSLAVATWVLVWAALRRRRLQEAAIRDASLERRMEIARDLHDTVAAKVAAIGLQAAAADRVLERDPAAARAALGQVEEAARGANADLRRMLEVLRSTDDRPLHPEPDLTDLPALVDSFRQAGLDVTMRLSPSVGAVEADRAVSRATYRIVQEALTNAARHAPGAAVDGEVAVVGRSLLVRVTNTAGQSTDTGGGSGFGLRGMRERVLAFGGDLETGPTADGGFEVRARLPIAAPDTGVEPGQRSLGRS